MLQRAERDERYCDETKKTVNSAEMIYDYDAVKRTTRHEFGAEFVGAANVGNRSANGDDFQQ